VVLNFESRPRAFTPPGGLATEGRLELATNPDRQAGPVTLQPLELGPDEGVLVRLP
jgi:hypothetical protein